jgi:hypothetical protein
MVPRHDQGIMRELEVDLRAVYLRLCLRTTSPEVRQLTGIATVRVTNHVTARAATAYEQS